MGYSVSAGIKSIIMNTEDSASQSNAIQLLASLNGLLYLICMFINHSLIHLPLSNGSNSSDLHYDYSIGCYFRNFTFVLLI